MTSLNSGKPEMPKVAPMPIKPNPRPTPVSPNHPAVAAHIEQWNGMAAELDRLRAENEQLGNELEVERRHCHELQHMVDNERLQKEKFQRYAVKADTYFETLASTATMAREESYKMASEQQKKIEGPPLSVDELEAGVAEIAAKFAPRKDEL